MNKDKYNENETNNTNKTWQYNQKNDTNKKSELKTYGSKSNLHVVTLCEVEINGLN